MNDTNQPAEHERTMTDDTAVVPPLPSDYAPSITPSEADRRELDARATVLLASAELAWQGDNYELADRLYAEADRSVLVAAIELLAHGSSGGGWFDLVDAVLGAARKNTSPDTPMVADLFDFLAQRAEIRRDELEPVARLLSEARETLAWHERWRAAGYPGMLPQRLRNVINNPDDLERLSDADRAVVWRAIEAERAFEAEGSE